MKAEPPEGKTQIAGGSAAGASLSTTIAGLRQTGVSGARRLEIRQIPVTWSTLPQSIPYSRARRDVTPLAGWTAPVLGPGTGREGGGGSFQQACNRLATCLQLLCNHRQASVVLRCCSGGARGPRSHSLSPKGAPAPAGLRLAWCYRQGMSVGRPPTGGNAVGVELHRQCQGFS